MSKRITVRLPDEVYEQLSKAVKGQGTDVSDVVRRTLLTHLNGVPPHEAAVDGKSDSYATHRMDDCARAILTDCEPDTRRRVTATAKLLGMPLSDVITSLLVHLSRRDSIPERRGNTS